MESPFADQLQQAMAGLQEHRARMQEAQLELQAATASVTSKDRLVTAVVGPQGQVMSITFHTDDYREMAPAQLGRVLTDVLNAARAQMGEKVTSTMRNFQGLGDMLRQTMVGGADAQLEELLTPLRAMRPGFAEDEAKRNRRKQEEFNG
ncbi:YbaB/EbfC family nucleoid-associated protein [Kitasatospora sp. LaBMicrA B282]|uniref:YbaB/EbfC family nucleoid-associated protein n=1 Tax=Kitasatospora sp. LaBMicrA B282 TaxID=3420949 RepID=UPI003D0C3EA4